MLHTLLFLQNPLKKSTPCFPGFSQRQINITRKNQKCPDPPGNRQERVHCDERAQYRGQQNSCGRDDPAFNGSDILKPERDQILTGNRCDGAI